MLNLNFAGCLLIPATMTTKLDLLKAWPWAPVACIQHLWPDTIFPVPCRAVPCQRHGTGLVLCMNRPLARRGTNVLLTLVSRPCQWPPSTRLETTAESWRTILQVQNVRQWAGGWNSLEIDSFSDAQRNIKTGRPPFSAKQNHQKLVTWKLCSKAKHKQRSGYVTRHDKLFFIISHRATSSSSRSQQKCATLSCC